jgi:hypothetical protein
VWARTFLSTLLVVFLVGCSYTSTSHPKAKPTPVVTLTQSQVTSIAKNFWEQSQADIINNDPVLMADVYAGPALDRARADLYILHHDPYRLTPLPKYPSTFESATQINLAQPPQATWFATMITYDAKNQDGVTIGQQTEGPWIFVFVPAVPGASPIPTPNHAGLASPSPSASARATGSPVSPSPSASVKAGSGGPVKASPSPSPTSAPNLGTWMAYYNYGGIEDFGAVNLDQPNGKLAQAKASDYLYSAGSLPSDYATYLNMASQPSVVAPPPSPNVSPLPSPSPPPYATGITDFSQVYALVGTNDTYLASKVDFQPYANLPSISYRDVNQDEVVVFALQRTVTYTLRSLDTCKSGASAILLPGLDEFGNYNNVLVGNYRSVTVVSDISVVATIPLKSKPTQGGRLLVGLDGETRAISVKSVSC